MNSSPQELTFPSLGSSARASAGVWATMSISRSGIASSPTKKVSRVVSNAVELVFAIGLQEVELIGEDNVDGMILGENTVGSLPATERVVPRAADEHVISPAAFGEVGTGAS